ncbi:MAG: secretin N-terminal domain-containing protein [Phycisphaerales bacterium]
MPQRKPSTHDTRPGLLLGMAAGLAISLATAAAMAQNQPQGSPAGERSPALVPEPGAEGGGQDGQQGGATQSDEPIIIGPFAEPVQLRTLLDIAVARLGVQLAVDTSLTGSVMITQELRIPPEQYLRLLNSFLEQNGFAMVPGAIDGFYQVVPKASVPAKPGGDLATTLVIRTPNTKPSVLQQAIVSQTSTDGSRIAALDELGVLIVTASPGTAMEIRDLVNRILAERDEQKLIPFELTHIAAGAGRDQVLRLAGVLEDSATPGVPDPRARGGQPEGGGSFVATALSNLGQRLIVAPSGNRLLFRGTEDEADRVAELISIVDVKDDLQPTRYRTGSATANVAALAEQRGLGSVIQFSSMNDQGGLGSFGGRQGTQFPGQAGGLQQQPQVQGGSAIVVDEVGQSIVFYGTPQQHEQFAALVNEYDPGDEQVVIRSYELDWAKAEEVSTLLTELIEGASAAATGDLLPGSGQTGRQATARQPRTPDQFATPDDAFGDIQSPEAFVTFDEATNQVMVRAPLNMQAEFRRIIETIDKRRPQVFIEAKILAVTWTDDMRLAFESQIINSGGSDGLFQTNFGLTEPSGDATDPNIVDDGLLGFTSAVIRSNYVPIVINAFQRNVNGRILASPQLLVDNNTESTIASVESQPFQTTSQDGTSTQTGFGGFEDAGPQLTVRPRINPGGFVTLEYDLTLSNFVGSGSDGIPPPRQERTVTSESVTIPSDSTIIVGGITIENDGKTQVRVPLLGSIPILGYLFADTNWNDAKTTLYVFITPKVLYEPTITDYELLTEGPRRVAELDDDVPELETFMLRVMVPKEFAEGTSERTPADEYGIEIIEPESQGL